METLVLNAQYQAVDRVSWQKAFQMVFTGRAEVVETYNDRVVRSPREVFPMPSIVRFVRRVRKFFPRSVAFNRRNVYLRDKGRCQYCRVEVSANDFTLEHIVPRAQGGRTSWVNIVVACIGCNRRKGHRTPQEAGMRLLSKPVRPKSLPRNGPAKLVWREGMPVSWKDYLRSVGYWHAPLQE